MSVKNIIDAVIDQDLRQAKKLFSEEMKARAVARIMEHEVAIARQVMGEGEFELDDEFDEFDETDEFDDELDEFDELDEIDEFDDELDEFDELDDESDDEL